MSGFRRVRDLVRRQPVLYWAAGTQAVASAVPITTYFASPEASYDEQIELEQAFSTGLVVAPISFVSGASAGLVRGLLGRPSRPPIAHISEDDRGRYERTVTATEKMVAEGLSSGAAEDLLAWHEGYELRNSKAMEAPRRGALVRSARVAAGAVSAGVAYALTKDARLAGGAYVQGLASAYFIETGHNVGYRVGTGARTVAARLVAKTKARRRGR